MLSCFLTCIVVVYLFSWFVDWHLLFYVFCRKGRFNYHTRNGIVNYTYLFYATLSQVTFNSLIKFGFCYLSYPFCGCCIILCLLEKLLHLIFSGPQKCDKSNLDGQLVCGTGWGWRWCWYNSWEHKFLCKVAKLVLNVNMSFNCHNV